MKFLKLKNFYNKKIEMENVIYFTTICPIILKYIKYDQSDKYYSLYIDHESKKLIGYILMICSLCFTFFNIINIRKNISLLKICFFINIMNFFLSILYMIYKKNILIPDIGCILIIVLNITWLSIKIK